MSQMTVCDGCKAEKKPDAKGWLSHSITKSGPGYVHANADLCPACQKKRDGVHRTPSVRKQLMASAERAASIDLGYKRKGKK